MGILRDRVDEALTEELIRQMGSTTLVDQDTGCLVITSGGCVINVDRLMEVILSTIRENL